MAKKTNNNDANLGFETELFRTADKLRGNMEPSDYKHVALGLIFLKHISDSFEAKHTELLAEYPEGAEDPDEYAAENVFWVPKESRWSHLQANAKQPGIGKLIDEAMLAIEKVNPSLKGVLPKDYARPALNAVMLGELIDLISGIAMGEGRDKARDVLGRVYEYFLGQFAGSEGKRGGEFYTPRSVVRTMVEMLEPYKGRGYDPCCGSGGMFVQSEKFVEEHGGRIGDIAIYGQESNYVTWRLAKMNLAVRGIDADIRWNSEGQFPQGRTARLARPTYILANPPFNVSDWGGERLREDRPVEIRHSARRQRQLRLATAYPSITSAPNGTAGVVLANGSMSSGYSRERATSASALIEGGVVDCMIALPGQLFYSTQIPACLWFLAKQQEPERGPFSRPARGRCCSSMRASSDVMVDRIRDASFRGRGHRPRSPTRTTRWREAPDAATYEDVPGFCKSADARGNRGTQSRPDARPLCGRGGDRRMTTSRSRSGSPS